MVRWLRLFPFDKIDMSGPYEKSNTWLMWWRFGNAFRTSFQQISDNMIALQEGMKLRTPNLRKFSVKY